MTWLWILLAIGYVACWLYLGLATVRTRGDWLPWIGVVPPVPVDHRGLDRAHVPEPFLRKSKFASTASASSRASG
jgi:hypothetical protein